MTNRDRTVMVVIFIIVLVVSVGFLVQSERKVASQAELIEALTVQPVEAETNDAPMVTWGRNVRSDIAIELGFVGKGKTGNVIWCAVERPPPPEPAPVPEKKKGWFGREKK